MAARAGAAGLRAARAGARGGRGRAGAAGAAARRGGAARARAFVLTAQKFGVPRGEGAAGPADIVLRQGAGTVGADASCDYVVDLDAVSSTHAKLEIRGRKVMVTDLGSTNGTSVGHMKVRPNLPQQLGPGKKVVFGDIRAAYFLVEDEEVAEPAVKAAAPPAEPAVKAEAEPEPEAEPEAEAEAAAEPEPEPEPAPAKEKKVKKAQQWFNFKRAGKPAKS